MSLKHYHTHIVEGLTTLFIHDSELAHGDLSNHLHVKLQFKTGTPEKVVEWDVKKATPVLGYPAPGATKGAAVGLLVTADAKMGPTGRIGSGTLGGSTGGNGIASIDIAFSPVTIHSAT